MGTKIDDSVKYLTAMRKTYQADSGHLSVAIDIMRKYQKIEQIAREGKNETRCEEIVRIIDGKA